MDQETREAYCTVCRHEMQDPAYHIFLHPLLRTCVCRQCIGGSDESDSEQDESEESDEDKCCWCAESSETLYICGDGQSCPYQFCASCIESNLGKDFVHRVLDVDGDWTCLVCNPAPLAKLVKVAESALAESMYSTVTGEIGNDEGETVSEQDHQIAIQTQLWRMLADMQKHCDECLSEENLSELRRNIREELIATQSVADEASLIDKVEAEVAAFQEDIKKSREIFGLQEADCSDEFRKLGVSEIGVLVEPLETLVKKAEPHSAPEHLFNRTPAESSSSHVSSKLVPKRDPKILHDITRMNELRLKARNDPNLKLVNGSDALQTPHAYPPEFEDIIPVAVLQAFAAQANNLRPKAREALFDEYEVPPFARIVLSHIHDKRPSESHIVTALEKHQLHPSVIKAIFHETNRVKSQELNMHYNLQIDDTVDLKNSSDWLTAINEVVKAKQRNDFETAQSLQEYVNEEEEAEDDFLDKHKSALDVRTRSCTSNRVTLSEDDDVRMEQEALSKSVTKFSSKFEKRISKPLMPAISSVDEMDAMDISHEVVEPGKESGGGGEVPQSSPDAGGIASPAQLSSICLDPDQDKSKETSVLSNKRNLLSSPLIVDLTSSKRTRLSYTVVDLSALSDSDDDMDIILPQGYLEKQKETNSDGLLEPTIFSRNTAPKSADSSRKSKLKLSIETTAALADERARLERLRSLVVFHDSNEETIVLNTKRNPHEPIVRMNADFNSLKAHQIEGVRFMWDNVIGSVEELQNNSATNQSRGCLIAHCMGLGKTLTTIAFVVTLLTNKVLQDLQDPIVQLSLPEGQPLASQVEQGNAILAPVKKRLFQRVLIIAPKNTLSNWRAEFKKWASSLFDVLNVVVLSDSANSSTQSHRSPLQSCQHWFECGGVLLMTDAMFSSKVGTKNSTVSTGLDTKTTSAKHNDHSHLFRQYLCDPGPDLVIVDEAHYLKNEKTKFGSCIKSIRTKRRIALTGSPLQNNLKEYWTMIDWIKPLSLCNFNEFKDRFIVPITAGSSKDASLDESKRMRKKIYLLNKKLSAFVHRKDMSLLEKELHSKREFVLFLKMTPFQSFLFNYYLSLVGKKKKTLFSVYPQLLRIINSPACAALHMMQQSHLDTSLQSLCDVLKESYARFAHQQKEMLSRTELPESSVRSRLGDRSGSGSDSGSDSDNDSDIMGCSSDSDSSSVDSRSTSPLARMSLAPMTTMSTTLDIIDISTDSDTSSVMSLASARPSPIANRAAFTVVAEKQQLDSKVFRGETNDHDEEEVGGNDKQEQEQEQEQKDVCPPDWWMLKNFDCDGDVPHMDVARLIDLSSKMTTVLSLLAMSISMGDKVIIFSQNLVTLDFLEMVLQSDNWSASAAKNSRSQCTQWKKGEHYLRIDGNVADRQPLIEKFNEDSNVKAILISTRAGNMGINLPAANRIILVDCSWNPAHDLQAIYRAYRIGQKKSVFVYRLIYRGTIEEKIFKRQITKQILAAGVVDRKTAANAFSAVEQGQLLKEERDHGDAWDKDSLLAVPRSGLHKDDVLAQFIESIGHSIVHAIDDNDSFLQDQENLRISEEDERNAHDEDERETAEREARKAQAKSSKQLTAVTVPAQPIGDTNGTDQLSLTEPPHELLDNEETRTSS